MSKSRRRARAGAGSVAQRKNGLWEARLDQGWHNGKRLRQSFYGKTAREAQEKLDEAKAKAASGVAALGRTPTVTAWLESWLEETARPRLRPSTYIRYRELIHRHIVPGIGKERLARLSVPTVQQFLNERRRGGLSAQTVHHLRAVLRTALNHAIRCRVVQYNAAALAASPKISRREPTFLAPHQAAQFLEAVGTDRLGALYTLCFSTGLRQGEALALRWEDVDTEQGVLRVGYTLRRVRLAPNQPRTLLRSDTKTVASRRVLPLAPFVAAAIQHHRERQLFERRAADDNWNDTGYVFTDKVGRPVEADHLGRSFAVFLLRAGLPRMRFHDLRHSCATLLLAAGVPPRTVMSYLGHSNLGTTMAIYGHVSPHMLGEAAATMQKQLAGTPS